MTAVEICRICCVEQWVNKLTTVNGEERPPWLAPQFYDGSDDGHELAIGMRLFDTKLLGHTHVVLSLYVKVMLPCIVFLRTSEECSIDTANAEVGLSSEIV